jgi:LysM repeat protein
MNPFYKLNETLANIGKEQDKIAENIAKTKAAPKTPARITLEESLKQDLKSLMEDGTGGMNFSGAGSLEEDDGLEGIAKKHGMKYHRGTYGANMSHPTKGYVDINRYGEWSHHKQGNEFSGRGHGASTARGDSSQHFSDLDNHLSSLSEGEKWIQKATKPSTKGDLHKALHVSQGETIPKGKIEKATHSKNAHLRHMAQFAKNIAHEDAEMDEADTMSFEDVCPVCHKEPCACKKGIPGNLPVKGKMDRLKGKRDFYEDQEMMAYLRKKANLIQEGPWGTGIGAGLGAMAGGPVGAAAGGIAGNAAGDYVGDKTTAAGNFIGNAAQKIGQVAKGAYQGAKQALNPSAPVKAAPAAPQPYTVVAGDNLTKIAKQMKTTLPELLKANPQYQKNPNLIKPGEKVNPPAEGPPTPTGGGAAAAPAAPATPAAPAAPARPAAPTGTTAQGDDEGNTTITKPDGTTQVVGPDGNVIKPGTNPNLPQNKPTPTAAAPAPAVNNGPWPAGSPQAAAYSKMTPADQKWLGGADPTDVAILSRAPNGGKPAPATAPAPATPGVTAGGGVVDTRGGIAGQDEMEENKKYFKENARSRTYNGRANDADAYNGMEFEGNAFTGKLKSTPKGGKFSVGGREYTDTSAIEEAMTRQHFRHTAELLKHIDDPVKRMELAKHHADMFKASNPRFNHDKFYKACGLDECGMYEDDMTDEGNAFTGKLHSTPKGGKFKLGNKEFTDSSDIDEGFAEMDAWLKQREAEKGTGKFDKRKTSTGTVYTRKPETFDEPEGDEDQPAIKRGRGRPSKAPQAHRFTKGAWKHKDPMANEDSEHGESMTKNQIHTIRRAAKELEAVIQSDESVPEWVKSKITVASDYLSKVRDYLESNMERSVERATGEEGVTISEKSNKEKDVEKNDRAERAGKKVVKDIEYDEKVKDKIHGKKRGGEDAKAEKAGRKVAKDIEYDEKKEEVEETTTSGSVSTSTGTPKSSKGGMSIGKGIYDSFNREVESMISESFQVKSTVAENMMGDEDSITITATGNDVDRIKELLQHMGISHNVEAGHEHGEELDELTAEYPGGSTNFSTGEVKGSYTPAPTTEGKVSVNTDNDFDAKVGDIITDTVLGNVKLIKVTETDTYGQFAEGIVETEDGRIFKVSFEALVGNDEPEQIEEADVTVDENDPDYPTNQEYDDDALQYSGGLNGPKHDVAGNGQTTIPVTAVRVKENAERSIFDLYKAIETLSK